MAIDRCNIVQLNFFKIKLSPHPGTERVLEFKFKIKTTDRLTSYNGSDLRSSKISGFTSKLQYFII